MDINTTSLISTLNYSKGLGSNNKFSNLASKFQEYLNSNNSLVSKTTTPTQEPEKKNEDSADPTALLDELEKSSKNSKINPDWGKPIYGSSNVIEGIRTVIDNSAPGFGKLPDHPWHVKQAMKLPPGGVFYY